MAKTVQIETTAAEPVSGIEIFVPLNKLKKSPKNARKVPHGEAAIEALAASIEHKGLIQNLVIEPEMKGDKPTGAYFVTAGEGRRLAYLLRAKRRQIEKNHPVRCRLDTENDPSEISLAMTKCPRTWQRSWKRCPMRSTPFRPSVTLTMPT